MGRFSALRQCRRTPSGYWITPDLVHKLATNPKLAGIWRWGETDPIPGNHEAAVPEDLFLAAYELAVTPGKPKGRAAKGEPLEWGGLLWCCNHPHPEPVSINCCEGEYRCQQDYFRGQGQFAPGTKYCR